MSLIVARKEGDYLTIVSDTKISQPENLLIGQRRFTKEGTVKTIILSSQICLSIAGEIDFDEMSKLLSRISNIDGEEVKQALIEYNQQSSNKSEFILCLGKPKPSIFLITDGKCIFSEQAWIGEKEAFNMFQKHFLETKQNTSKSKKLEKQISQTTMEVVEMKLSVELNSKSSISSKMSTAIDEVIESGNIDSVGGFKIHVEYDQYFYYKYYMSMYHGNVKHYGFGPHLIGHGAASEGAYTICCMGASRDYLVLALHIKQANLGILYKREPSTLFLTETINLDEVDFLDYISDNFKIEPSTVTENKFENYSLKAKSHFEKEDFERALFYLEKLCNVTTGKHKAECLINRGTCLIKLNRKKEAMICYQEAHTLDSSKTGKLFGFKK